MAKLITIHTRKIHMNYNEALQKLIEGQFVARKGWAEERKYCVIMPLMPFVWLIQTQPNPNAGVWMASVADFQADDWELVKQGYYLDMPEAEAAPEVQQEAPVA